MVQIFRSYQGLLATMSYYSSDFDATRSDTPQSSPVVHFYHQIPNCIVLPGAAACAEGCGLYLTLKSKAKARVNLFYM